MKYLVHTVGDVTYVTTVFPGGKLYPAEGSTQYDDFEQLAAAVDLNAETTEVDASLATLLSSQTPVIDADNVLRQLGVSREHLRYVIAYVQAEDWSAENIYSAGDKVAHEGRLWVALSDVAQGVPPDLVYDLDTNTGGWVST